MLTKPFVWTLCYLLNHSPTMWPDIVQSTIAPTSGSIKGSRILNLQHCVFRYPFIVIYRLMRPLIEIPAHTIIPHLLNRALSCTNSGIFRVTISLQIKMHKLLKCPVKQESLQKRTLFHSCILRWKMLSGDVLLLTYIK